MKPPQARLRLLDLNLPLHSPTKRPLSSGLFFVAARAPNPVAAAIGFFDRKKPAPDGLLASFDRFSPRKRPPVLPVAFGRRD
jgi:hypothetical protein